jgi:Tfp pilus assembly protein PilF
MDEREIQRLAEEALEALRSGDHVRAVGITDGLVAVAPNDATVRALRAEALWKSDAAEEALAEARQAVDLDPQNHRNHTLLGVTAWQAGRLTLAQQSLERAIELSGRKPGVLADYAWFMASERGPRLAEQAAREAVRANRESSTAWAALGLAQFRLHRRREAEASLKRALKLDPNDPFAQSVMVTLLHDQRKDKSAVALAHLLADTPGTEPLVEAVRDEAKRRRIEGEVVQRNPAWDPARVCRGRRIGLGLLAALGAVMTAGALILLFQWLRQHLSV